MNKEIQRSGGVGFAGLLTILFVGLKLTGNVTWTWPWVLAPLWMSVILAVIIAIIVVAVESKLK